MQKAYQRAICCKCLCGKGLRRTRPAPFRVKPCGVRVYDSRQIQVAHNVAHLVDTDPSTIVAESDFLVDCDSIVSALTNTSEQVARERNSIHQRIERVGIQKLGQLGHGVQNDQIVHLLPLFSCVLLLYRYYRHFQAQSLAKLKNNRVPNYLTPNIFHKPLHTNTLRPNRPSETSVNPYGYLV